jgi:ribosomal protein L34E
MKAARFYGPGDVRIDDIPEPRTRPGTVKVEVEWCGICGTDLHEYLESRMVQVWRLSRTRARGTRALHAVTVWVDRTARSGLESTRS